jgi:hypothetical protein
MPFLVLHVKKFVYFCISKTGLHMLQIGTKAPYFEGLDGNGNTVRLSDFKGKRPGPLFLP